MKYIVYITKYKYIGCTDSQNSKNIKYFKIPIITKEDILKHKHMILVMRTLTRNSNCNVVFM